MNKRNTLLAALLFISPAVVAREGVYAEYKVTSASVNGNNKTWVSDGDMRTEIGMKSPMAPGMPSVVTLALHNEPSKIYMLTEKDKTYLEMSVGKLAANAQRDDDDYEVTILGKEKADDYNCTHVKVTNKRTQHTFDMWVSKDVQGYENYKGMKNQYFGGKSFYSKLKDQGADGFVVRVKFANEHSGDIQLDLVKVEKEDMPESLFSLDGYSKGASYDMSKMADSVKNMTPGQRKAFIEQMAKQYGK